MKISYLIIVILFLATGIFYYNLTGNVTRKSKDATVQRVIDGDTIETNIGKIRLLGINTPEKSMPVYEEAKEFTEKLLLNKTVQLEISGTDKYGRILAQVFLNNLHVNNEIIKNGYASLYYYEHDKYYDDLSSAEEHARKTKLGIWSESPDKNCLSLLELKYKEEGERCTNGELLKIQNICDKEISVIIKDDATHIYNEKIKASSIFTKNFSCIWNDESDSLYAWDEQGMVLFYRY